MSNCLLLWGDGIRNKSTDGPGQRITRRWDAISDRKAPQSRTEGTEGAMGGQAGGTIGDLSVHRIGE